MQLFLTDTLSPKVKEPHPTTSGGEKARKDRGRPPIDLEVGPMRGEVLNNYKLEHQRESREAEREEREKERISEVRRLAVSMRADRGGQEELLREDSPEVEREASLEVEVREEQERPKAAGKTWFLVKLKDAKEIMLKMSLFQQVVKKNFDSKIYLFFFRLT